MRTLLVMACLLVPAVAAAQETETLQLGTLATLAPLCGLRAEPWAFDLRRAAIQSATGTKRFDDAGLDAAPGSAHAVASLSYAEAEALESFAEAPPGRTCGPLATDPELARADEIVARFRAGKTGS